MIINNYAAICLTYPSFLQTKLKNPTQSDNGGGDQMYDRVQQAAEHIFLPFPHKMTFFEHQNPYVIYPSIQDELKEKRKVNEQNENDHLIFQKSLDEELGNSMKLLSKKIAYSKITKINDENDNFKFKLNPHIGTDNKNDSMISNVLIQSEALSKANENAKTGKFMKYAAEEYNKTLKYLENNSQATVGDQLSNYDLKNLNISENFLNQNIITQNISNLDTSEQIVKEDSSHEEIDELKSILKNRTEAIKNNNGYNGLQTLFPENKKFTDFRNKTIYNGWIHPVEIPYFDKLYLDGYYQD